MPEVRFAEFVAQALLRLPQDLKVALRIVEDADVADEGRAAVAGAVLSILAGTNYIPGLNGTLALVDDVLVLRLALERAHKTSPEAFAVHAEEAPEFVGQLAADLAVVRGYLGDKVGPLEKAVDGLGRVIHQGHGAQQCVQDVDASTWLYDAVHEAIVERLELDEDTVVRDVKAVATILPALQTRMGR